MFGTRLKVIPLLAAILLASLAALAQPVQVIPLTGGSWRYNQSNNLDGVMWMAPGYDDTQPLWQEGPALLSNDTGNGTISPMIGRVINGPRVAAQGVVQHAYYFRTRFNWTPAPLAFTTLDFNVRIDDGAIFFLNGTEIHRIRVNPGTAVQFAAQNFASSLACGGDPDCGDDLSTVILTNGAPLIQGENVLAAIVYQNGTDSSDITFGASLSVTPPVAPTIVDANQPSNRVVVADRLTTLSVIANGLPAACQWYFEPSAGGGFTAVMDGAGIGGAQTTALTISNMAPANAGSYYCVIANGAGMVNSRTAIVQYTIDTNGPVVVRAAGSATFDRFFLEFDEPLEVTVATDTANYQINGVNPDTAALSPDGRIVTLGSAHAADMDFTIQIPAIALSDPVGNFMAETQLVVHSFILTSCGGMLFESYNTGGGVNVTDFTNNAIFPNKPTRVVRTNDFNSDLVWQGLVDTDPARENYGARMRALFFPTNTGLHRFYLLADDGSQLYLNPNGPDAAGRQLLLNRTACCGDYASANSRSAPFLLQAGQGYYLEILYKEAGGGDYGYVAVRPDGSATPPTSERIPGDMLGFTAVPPGIVGAIIVTQPPTNTTVEAPGSATFSIVASASGAPFVCYQWQKAEAGGGGVFTDLPGAMTPTYTTGPTTVADDNGDQYRVVINALSGSVTSAVATLSVTPDVTRPRVVKVVPTSATGVSIIYSEPMSVDATDTVNYALDGGVMAAGAVVNGSNPNRIDLTTTPMTLGNFYTLTIPSAGNSMTDPTGNAIDPNPTSATFRAQTYGGDPATVITLPTAGMLPIGALANRGILVRLAQISVAKPNGNAITEQILGGVYPSAASPLPNIAPLPLHLETGAINYNKDGPTSLDGSLTPDAQFPGFGSVPLAVLDNLVFEAVCYVELRRGVYRSIVRSDDAFRLSLGLSVEDPNTFLIGQFDAGRGVADTPLMDFCVTQDGLYPMRLIYEEGNGGAAIEWKIEDLESPGTYYGVNSGTVAAGFPGGSPNAYVPLCVDPVLSIQVNGANHAITWPLGNGGNLYQLQSTTALANPSSATVWSNVGVIPQTSGANKHVSLPNAGGSVFFRLFRPGLDCSP